jgi:hypothetical protein
VNRSITPRAIWTARSKPEHRRPHHFGQHGPDLQHHRKQEPAQALLRFIDLQRQKTHLAFGALGCGLRLAAELLLDRPEELCLSGALLDADAVAAEHVDVLVRHLAEELGRCLEVDVRATGEVHRELETALRLLRRSGLGGQPCERLAHFRVGKAELESGVDGLVEALFVVGVRPSGVLDGAAQLVGRGSILGGGLRRVHHHARRLQQALRDDEATGDLRDAPQRASEFRRVLLRTVRALADAIDVTLDGLQRRTGLIHRPDGERELLLGGGHLRTPDRRAHRGVSLP